MQGSAAQRPVAEKGHGDAPVVGKLRGEAYARGDGKARRHHAVRAQHPHAVVEDVHRAALAFASPVTTAEQF